MHYSPVLWFIASAVCLRLETNCRWETRSKPWPLFRRGPLRRGSADRRSGHLSAEQNYVLSFRPHTWHYPTRKKEEEEQKEKKKRRIRYVHAEPEMTKGYQFQCTWQEGNLSGANKDRPSKPLPLTTSAVIKTTYEIHPLQACLHALLPHCLPHKHLKCTRQQCYL